MPDDSLPQPPFIWEEAALKYGADLERVRVWNAFSEFFLDTELDSNDLDRIAEILADSPFSIEELKHIYDKEVSPVCSWNLLLIAGEWAGFNEDWLIPKCKKQQMKHRFDPNNKKGIFGRILDTLVQEGPKSVYLRAEKFRESQAKCPPVSDFTVYARLELFPTELSKKTLAIRNSYGCPMLIRGRYHDCRLYFPENDSVAPGQRYEPVGIEFLVPELVYPKIRVGVTFLLWEREFFASGEIIRVEVDADKDLS